MSKQLLKKYRGIGLIELMLVLLIIVIIIFTATYYFRVTSENLKVTQAEEMINNIVQASYKWLEGNPNFAGINIDVLQSAGFLPANYDTNPWKGKVSIEASSPDNSKLLLKMEAIPTESCTNLVEKMNPAYSKDAACITSITSQLQDFSGTF